MHCRELCEFTEVKAKGHSDAIYPYCDARAKSFSQVTRLCGWCLLYEGVDRMRAARLSKQLRFPFGAAPSFDCSSILWHCIAKARHRRRSHRDNTIQNLLPTCTSNWQVSCHYPWAYLRLLITRSPVAAYGKASLGLRTCIVIEVRGAAVALFSASEHRAPV